MTTIDLLLVGIGIGMLALAFTVGPAFYPPGEGYAEERFYRRLSLALITVGMVLIAAPLLWNVTTVR